MGIGCHQYKKWQTITLGSRRLLGGKRGARWRHASSPLASLPHESRSFMHLLLPSKRLLRRLPYCGIEKRTAEITGKMLSNIL